MAETTDLSYTDSGLDYAKTYYYRVYAVSTATGTEIRALSAKVSCSTRLATPEVFPAADTPDAIGLLIDPVPNAAAYRIYRAGSKSGTYKEIAETTDLQYFDPVATGKTYYYKVRAVFSDGETDYISKLSAAVKGKARPSAPAVYYEAQAGGVRVSFEGAEGADGFIVYRATKKGGVYSRVFECGNIEGITATINAKAGKTYYYKVRAYTVVNGTNVYSVYTNPVKVVAK